MRCRGSGSTVRSRCRRIAARCARPAYGRRVWPRRVCAGGPAFWTTASRSLTPSPTTARYSRRAAGLSTRTERGDGPAWCVTTRHGLWQLDAHIAYLSGDELPPGVRGFEVLEQLAFDERRLRQALSALDCGSLEILVRGVEGDPDALRRRWAPRGSRSLSVLIPRLGKGAAAQGIAFVCRSSR